MEVIGQSSPAKDRDGESQQTLVRQATSEDNRTISTIMRFHNKERLQFLDEALFSLSIQSWRDHEIIIVVQNGDKDMERTIEEIVARQPWPSSASHSLISVSVPAGRDGRSTLLNRGIERASGRYLAFLDDDDIIYHHCYTKLIHQLELSGGAVAVGGCRTARVRKESDYWYVMTKEMPFSWGRTRNDLLRDNFVPIHSYVIDRSRINPEDLWFDDECPPLEDYDFLLRLCSRYDFDFSNLDIPVCEYRIHSMNSLPYTVDTPAEALSIHQRAQQVINERKKKILCSVTVSEFTELLEQVNRQDQEQAAIQKRLNQYELDNQHEQGRFLNSFVRNTYKFFGRFPKLESRLSRITHKSWSAYEGIKAGRKAN